MKNIDKVLIIIGVICVLVIILCFALYIKKYYIIYKFQKKIDEIEEFGNYEIISDNFAIYVKNNIYVLNNYDKRYLISDKNTFKNFIITPNNFQNIGSARIKNISSLFSVKNSDEKTTILNIKNNLKYSQLTKVVLNEKECYKLVFSTITNSKKLTIYFDKKTYIPLAYNFEDEKINIIKINIGTVKDSDISVVKLYEELTELSS